MDMGNLVVGWAVIIWMGMLAIRSVAMGQIMIPGLIGVLFIVGVVMDHDTRSKVKTAERLERAKEETGPEEAPT